MNRRGFTLIELLITVTLVGILAAIALPNYNDAKRRATAIQIIGDFHAVRVAAFDVFVETGTFPNTAAWGTVPTELAPALPGGFTFSSNNVTYRWRRWSLPDGTPKNKKQTVMVGLILRTKDKALLQTIKNMYKGDMAFGSAKKVTLAILS